MKIRYSYFSLRFPDDLAKLCHYVEDYFKASYFDLPFLLPVESPRCRYNDTEIVSFLGRDFFLANERMDVCFALKEYSQTRCFGLIIINTEAHWSVCRGLQRSQEQAFVFWSNFYDDELIQLLYSFDGDCNVRIYTDPTRVSATLAYSR